MHLGHQRHATTFKAMDQIDLPERAAAIQGAREDASDLLLEPREGAGRDQRQFAHMEFDVEIRVVHPVGVVEAEGNLSETPLEDRNERQALKDEHLEILEPQDAARSGRRIEDEDARDVTVDARRLECEELRVETG